MPNPWKTSTKHSVKMAIQNAIVNLLNELESAVGYQTIVIINAERPTIKKLIKLLHDEKAIEILSSRNNKQYVKGNSDIIKISSTPEFKNVNNEHLVFELAKLIPTVNGTVILTTTDGLITHRQALERDIGGRIIGYFF